MTPRLLIAVVLALLCAAAAGLISAWVVVAPLAVVGGVFLCLLLGGRAPHWRRDG